MKLIFLLLLPAVAWADAEGALKQVSQHLDSGVVVLVVTVLVEFLMRVVKTTQPKSILYVAANLMKLFAEILVKLAQILDGVLQRLDQPSLKVDDNK